ncbi:MAG: alpha/beta hydrolase [Verrucomicrobiales bacterium]|nr:alpha/beta hydrolase [Verrucomicrobiales bacterium]
MSITQSAFSEPSEFIPLWPAGQVPGEADVSLPDEAVELKGDYRIEIMSNVSVPGITLYPAPEQGNSGTTVLVCPGGGYNILAYSHEGTEVCEWLNSIGVNAVLLKYRVPRRSGLEKHDAPLQDVHRAISMIRSLSGWKGMAGKVGVLGFSAGGHLSAMAVTSDGARTYTEADEYKKVSCVPDFGILVYPAYLQDEKSPNELSPEVKVTGDTPPVFIVVAHGDRKWVEGAAILYLAMRRNNRDAELHIFGKGGHGFGLKNTNEEIRSWSSLAGNWMQAMGYISAE